MQIIRQMKPEFIDDRGTITKLLDDGRTVIRSVLLITCKKGAIRANHYHNKDSHYVYMLSGKMEYTEQKVGVEQAKKESAIISAGDIIFTPPMHAHAMKFLEESIFLALATESRNQEAYEEDTKRIKLI